MQPAIQPARTALRLSAIAAFAAFTTQLPGGPAHAQSGTEDQPVIDRPRQPGMESGDHLTGPDEKQIERLIGDLGADDFTTRKIAEQRIIDLGPAAIDALHMALDEDDVEISLTAARLLQQIRVQFVRPESADEVDRLLANYWKLPAASRVDKIERLSLTPKPTAISALVRIARCDTDESIARMAALYVMESTSASQFMRPAELATEIKSAVGRNGRSSCRWLNQYAESLEHPDEFNRIWFSTVGEELSQAVERYNSHGRSLPDVCRLVRWYVEKAMEHGLNQSARSIARDYLVLVDETPTAIAENADWFIHLGLSDLVSQLSGRYPELFASSPSLQFRLAESEYRMARFESSAEHAQQAFDLMSAHPSSRVQIALQLKLTGYQRLATDLFEKTFRSLANNSIEYVIAGCLLAELYHELSRHESAVQTLAAVIDAIQSQPKLKDQAASHLPESMRELTARLEMYRADQNAVNGNRVEQLDCLIRAVEIAPSNDQMLVKLVDFAKSESEIKDLVDKLVATRMKELEATIHDCRFDLQTQTEYSKMHETRIRLARNYNLWARLAVSSGRDLYRALEFCNASLRLEPHRTEYMATLAECHGSLGDFATAIRVQRRIITYHPYQPQFKQALAGYEQAYESVRVATKRE